MRFGHVLRTARFRAGLSQRQLANLMGVGQASVHNWELCHRFPSTAHRHTAARVLTCPDLIRVPA